MPAKHSFPSNQARSKIRGVNAARERGGRFTANLSRSRPGERCYPVPSATSASRQDRPGQAVGRAQAQEKNNPAPSGPSQRFPPSRGLTLRSSGPPPAWPREPLWSIIRLAGPSRWRPLSSNVRPHKWDLRHTLVSSYLSRLRLWSRTWLRLKAWPTRSQGSGRTAKSRASQRIRCSAAMCMCHVQERRRSWPSPSGYASLLTVVQS